MILNKTYEERALRTFVEMTVLEKLLLTYGAKPNKKQRFIPSILLVSLLVAVISMLVISMPAAASDWPMYRNNASNTGTSSEIINLPLAEKWHSNAPLVEENGAVVSNGTVYMSTSDGQLYAFDVSTGAVISGFPITTGMSYGSPAIDSVNKKLYVLTNGKLYAFNLNGTSSWIKDVGSVGYNFNEGPIIDGGYVYIKAGGNLTKLSSDGVLQWYSPTSGMNTQPSIMGDYVYINSESGQIRKYNKVTGAEVTTGGFPISATSSQSALTTAGGKILHKADKLYAYNASDGSLIWSQPAGGDSTYYDSPAVSNGVVYVYGFDGKIYAFDENTGATLAGFPSADLNPNGSRNWGSPAVAGDKIFIGAGTSKNLTVLETAGTANAGSILAKYQTFSNDSQGFDLVSPVISDGVVFAMLDGGGLYSFFSNGTIWTGGAIKINDGAGCTESQNVTLSLDRGSNTLVNEMRISEDPLFSGAVWEQYSAIKAWKLSAGYGTKTVYVQYRDSNGQLSNVFNAKIEYSESCGIIISNLLPENNTHFGSNNILFSWTTQVNSTTEVYLKSQDEINYTHYTGDSSLLHTFVIDNLTRNKWYYYYVASGSATSEKGSFYIDNGIEFSQKSYNFTIDRDYSQQVAVSVINTDSKQHTLLVNAHNPYSDLIFGFIGNGSEDQEITLNPGESKDVTLSIFAQDAMLQDYSFPITLNSTDSSIYDNAVVNLKVRQPNINYTVTEIGADPYTLAKTFSVTNNGDRITDFSIFADGDLTNKVLFKPAISHANIGSGESFTFKLVPSIDSDTLITGDINVTGAGKYKAIAVNFSQSGGKTLYTSVLSNVTICLATNSWYCTNRPNIQNTLYLPPGFTSSDVNAAVLAINFSLPWNEADYRNHNVNISLNGHLVKSLIDTIPDGLYLIPIDPSYLNYGINATGANQINIDTLHLNGGHYVVATNIELRLKLNNLTTKLFADSQDQADNISKSMDFLCDKCVPRTGITSIEPSPASGGITVTGGQNATFNVSVGLKNAESGVLQVEVYNGSSLVTKSFKDVASAPKAIENFTLSFQVPDAAGTYEYKILARYREGASGGLNDNDFCDIRDQISYKITVFTSVELVGLEVNQAIQDWSNSVPLITDKTTYVRAHIQTKGNSEVRVEAQLRGFRNGMELPGSPLKAINLGGFIMARPDAASRRSNLWDSLNFRLPTEWLHGTIELRVERVDGSLDCREAAGQSNDCSAQVTFNPDAIP